MPAVFKANSEKFQFMVSEQWVRVLILIKSVRGYSVQAETQNPAANNYQVHQQQECWNYRRHKLQKKTFKTCQHNDRNVHSNDIINMDKTWMSVPTYRWRDTGPHRSEEDCVH